MRRLGSFACSLLVVGAWLGAQDGDWATYGRDPGGERFSPLDSIRRENVASLQVAWTFRTGDAYEPKSGRPTAFEATPLHVDGTLYLSTPRRPRHRARPGERPAAMGIRCQGPSRERLRRFREPRRVHVAAAAASAASSSRPSTRASSRSTRRQGQPIPGFGEQGTVDLRKGLRIAPTGFADYQVTSPPAVVGNTVVVGSAIADGTSKLHPSGEVRGFDAITGKLKWTWDPVPQDPIGRRGGFVEEQQRRPRRRRQRLVGDRGRSGAQPRLRADEQPEPRLLRRRAARRQPVRGLRRRAARGHRRARLALPDRSSRSLGLRRRVAADPVRLAQGRPDRRRRRRRLEDRPSLHPRSRDGNAAHSRRGASGSEERRAGRGRLADAAVPHGAAGARAHGVEARRGLGRDRGRPRLVPDDDERAAGRRVLHAAVAERHARHSRQRGRHGVGRHRARPDQRSPRSCR